MMKFTGEDVLRTINSLPAFRRSPHAIRLLEELHRNQAGLEWDALARLVFKKKGNVGARSASFRSLLYRVRQWLETAYSDPASPLQQFPRAEIHVDGRFYSLRFASEGTRPHLSTFWKRYLVCDDNARQIQTADRIFLRLGDHFYFRDIRSPGLPDWTGFLEPICDALGVAQGPFPAASLKTLQDSVLAALAEKVAAFLSESGNREDGGVLPVVTPDKVRSALELKFSPDISRHYVSAGEAVALTHVAELFQSFQKPVIFGNRVGTATDNELANLIQVGKPREGGALSAILDKQRFRVVRDRIEDNKAGASAALKDHLRTHADELSAGASPDRIKYALVTRCPHRKEPQIITSIVASHGRVTEAACRHLTSENTLAEVFRDLDWNIGSMPAEFQFVLRAEVSYGKDAERTTAKILGVEPGWYCAGEGRGSAQ